MARHFKGSGHILRFIEFMDVGQPNGWQISRGLPRARAMIGREFPIEPVDPNYAGKSPSAGATRTARARWASSLRDAGVLQGLHAGAPVCRGAALHLPVRDQGSDLRSLIRADAADEEISPPSPRFVAWPRDRYSEIRTEESAKLRKVDDVYIGG